MYKSYVKVLMTFVMGVSLWAHVDQGRPYALGQEDAKPAVEPLLVDVFLENTRLGDGITVIQKGKELLIPLGEACRLLAFPVEIDVVSRRAKGYSTAKDKTFTVDLAQGRADSKGQVVSILAESLHEESGDFFLTPMVFEGLFPVKCALDLRMSRLTFYPLEVLPIQQALARDASNIQGLMLDKEEGLTGEIHREPYRFLEFPMLDINLGYTKNQHVPSGPVQSSFLMGGDLFWMSSQMSASRDVDGKWRNRRFSLFREDPRGELLGFMHAQRVGLGTLQESIDLDLVGSLPYGHGLWVDNFPVAYRSRFAAKTFRGDLPVGWSVELFQNDALVGYQKDQGRGLYEFPDVPLRYGLNRFRLVFHGPFGEIREENQRMDIESQQVAPGKFYYQMVALEPDYRDYEMGGPRQFEYLEGKTGLMRLDYGLMRNLSLHSAFTRIPLKDGPHQYGSLGMRGHLSWLSFQGSLAQDDGEKQSTKGLAAEGILRTGLGFSTLTYRQSEYRRGFQKSDIFDYLAQSRGLRGEKALEIYGTKPFRGVSLGASFVHERNEYANGSSLQRDRVHGSMSFPGWHLAGSLTRSRDSLDYGPIPIDASLMLSTHWKKAWLQAEVQGRRLNGHYTMEGAGLSMDVHGSYGMLYRALVKTQGGLARNPVWMASVAKMQGMLAWGVDFQYSRGSGTTLGFRVQASFGREPRHRQWVSDARSMASQGGLSMAAFVDRNGNGKKDEAEGLIPGIRGKLMGSPMDNRSRKDDVLFQTHLSRAQELQLEVDESSLADSSQKARVRTWRIVPRAGHVTRLEIPVGIFGEIIGTTRLRRGETVENLGGIILELLDASGQVLRTLRSAYDGFFEILDVPLGTYQLRVSPDEVQRLKVKAPEIRTFKVTDQTNYFEGCDFVIEAPLPIDVKE